jgi:murein L,D-transpeptidase YcbB/YkuD
MDRPKEMASWVLGGEENGWGMEKVTQVIASRQRKVVVLDKKIPVHILYRTAYVDPDSNTIEFYEDVYGRDKLLSGAWDKAQVTEG